VPSSGVSTPLTSSPSLFSSSPSLLSNPTIGDSAKNCTTCGKKTRRDACTADDPSGQLGQQDGDGSVLRQGPLPPPQAPQSDLHFAGVDGNVLLERREVAVGAAAGIQLTVEWTRPGIAFRTVVTFAIADGVLWTLSASTPQDKRDETNATIERAMRSFAIRQGL